MLTARGAWNIAAVGGFDDYCSARISEVLIGAAAEESGLIGLRRRLFTDGCCGGGGAIPALDGVS